MAKKGKAKKPKKELTAPFFMLTYGDLMTLLLCFFVLLFAMSTIESVKFQAKVSIMQGTLGISQLYQHAPMQSHLPSPAVKISTNVISQAKITPDNSKFTTDDTSIAAADPVEVTVDDKLQSLRELGVAANLDMEQKEDEVILVLPTYGIFEKGSYKINTSSPQVHKAKNIYGMLAQQISILTDYDIFFVGHTDTIPIGDGAGDDGPKTNMELGFFRAVAMFDYFFSDHLRNRTRIVFASQGDNVPIVPDAALDSELRKNRRVQVHLKKVSR